MKCTNKIFKRFFLSLLTLALLTASGCGKETIIYPYSEHSTENAVLDGNLFSNAELSGFASELATVTGDITDSFSLEQASSGILCDLGNKEVLFAQNPFERKYPASITKLMTAYVAIKKCALDEIVTCTRGVTSISVPDAVVMGLSDGDTMTLDQALHLMLVSSYNDVSIAIAEHVSGTVEAFCKLMNEEAAALGATDTHFSNPHGLHEDDHYTTAYDLYLIFNEVLTDPTILEIIQCKQYQTTYHDRLGKEHSVTASTTNHYFRGTYEIPDSVTIVGGKTGTTDEGGYCLGLFVKDKYSNPYVAIILDANARDNLYKEMTELLLQVSN